MLNIMQSTSRSNEKPRWKVSMSLRDNPQKFHTDFPVVVGNMSSLVQEFWY
jgi:hypothetical protein